MASTKTDIFVYAHWLGMPEPKCIGVLSSQQAVAHPFHKILTFWAKKNNNSRMRRSIWIIVNDFNP